MTSLAGSERPVFQMELSSIGPDGPDAVFAGEGESHSFFSPLFTVAWSPTTRFEDVEYVIPGSRKGEHSMFRLAWDGRYLSTAAEGVTVRFGLNLPMSTQDYRGFPFYQVLRYAGKRRDVLDAYGKGDFESFLALQPIDVLQMDRLFREWQVVFVGVTPDFGPHLSTW